MKHRVWGGLVAAIVGLGALQGHADDKQLVYADFEKVENGRPVSARGGAIELWSNEDDHVHKATFQGAAGVEPPAPELVRIKQGDPNHAAKLSYALIAPNAWSVVAMEVHGLPDANGALQGEDVSGYKYLSMQIYATGIRILRLEVRTNESGKDTRSVYPMYQLEVKPSLNTYRIPLSGFVQPSYADVRVDPKDVLKKLTSIALIAFCNKCEVNQQGMIIVDNVMFEK